MSRDTCLMAPLQLAEVTGASAPLEWGGSAGRVATQATASSSLMLTS